jgi:hypothetical protein
VLQIFYSKLSNNNAIGKDGMSKVAPNDMGDPGGTAQGGAIYNAGSLSLFSSSVNTNTAQGGNGGNGAMGIAQTIGNPPALICLSPPGLGGQGGGAAGGGVYSTLAFTNNASIDGNTVMAGSGGIAPGPPPCVVIPAPLGITSGQNTVP